MRILKSKLLILLVFFLTVGTGVFSQQTYGDSVSLSIQVTVSGSNLELSWPLDLQSESIQVHRKSPSSFSWGAPIATLSGTATSFVDSGIPTNSKYDYRVTMISSTQLERLGYVSAGLELKANANRGVAIVVLEQSFVGDPFFDIAFNDYKTDLELDGWFPVTVLVDRNQSVASVKAAIAAVYNSYPNVASTVVLIGNVPVPYSGEINPDGHSDHLGAWPCDAYYGDFNGNWTDNSVNNTSSSNAFNHNIPGDGKFDNDIFPSDIESGVGRIDFSNLPSTGDEMDILISYLNKLHRYKHHLWEVQERALIDDNFQSYSEGFSQGGFRNFSALVGSSAIEIGDFHASMGNANSGDNGYLWAYGCGPGSYTSSGGVCTTSSLATDSLNVVFSLLFGSYFGDWNYTDGLLKTMLANGSTLSTVWSGRPNWHFYHMGVGGTLGESTRISQNNLNSCYEVNSTYTFFGKYASMSLLGDPALRMQYIEKPTSLSVSELNSNMVLNWTSAPNVDGYNVYRRYENSINFEKLNTELVISNQFVDSTLSQAGMVHYYVKSVELSSNPSGTFEKESIAVKTSGYSTLDISQNSDNQLLLYPNPTTSQLNIQANGVREVKVVSLDGKFLPVNMNEVSNGLSLDVSTYTTGTYILKVSFVNGSQAEFLFVKR